MANSSPFGNFSVTHSIQKKPTMTVPKEVPIVGMTWPVEVGRREKILSQCCKNCTISSGSCLISDQTDPQFLQKAKHRPRIWPKSMARGSWKTWQGAIPISCWPSERPDLSRIWAFLGSWDSPWTRNSWLVPVGFFSIVFYFDASWGLFNTQAGDGSRCLSYFT